MTFPKTHLNSADYGGFHGPVPPNRNAPAATTNPGIISTRLSSSNNPNNNVLGRSLSLRETSTPAKREDGTNNHHFHYVEAEIETHRHPSQVFDSNARHTPSYDHNFPASPLST